MATCSNLTSARSLPCLSIGGIESVYIANASNFSAATQDVNGQITGITLTASSKFFEFQQRPETALLTETITANLQNAAHAYDQVLTITFDNFDAASLNQFRLLTKGKTIAIIKFNDNTYKAVGFEADSNATSNKPKGLYNNSGSIESGTAIGDRNGASITLRSYSENPCPFVAPSVITSSIITFA